MRNVKNQTQIYKALCRRGNEKKGNLWPGKSNDNFWCEPLRILGGSCDQRVLGIQIHKYIV